MRLFDYIYEGVVEKALALDEPETGDKYSDEHINKMVSQLKTALSQAKKDSYVDDDAKNAILSDLEEKLDNWENVDRETEPTKPEPESDKDVENKEKSKEELENTVDKKKEDASKKSEKKKEENDKKKEDDEKEELPNNENRIIKSKVRDLR